MSPEKLLNRFIKWRTEKLRIRHFILILSVVVGILSGLTALALKTSVFYLHELLQNDTKFDFHNYLILIYPATGIFLTVMMKKFVIRDTIKHNISSILHSISKRNSLMKAHKTFSSMLGGILTAGFGGSIGLESPIISSGAAIGSNLGKLLKLNYKTITLLLACGASGAIAAIFNTPIAALVFAFEVLLIDLSQFSLIPILISSVSGALTTRFLFDEEILFDFKVVDSFELADLPFFAVFAILAGVFASYFQKVFLYIENRFENTKRIRYRILYSGIILGIIIFVFPPLYGEGFETIKLILSGEYGEIVNNSLFYEFKKSVFMVGAFFIFILMLKVVATASTLGGGGIGGIFAPSLFSGAILGFIFAYSLNIKGLVEISESNFALVGMAAVLGGTLHAPLTGIFLIAEITHGYDLFVPLMFTTTIAFITVKYLNQTSIFTTQLAQRGELITHHKDKAVLTIMKLESVIETDLTAVHYEANLGQLVDTVAHSKRNIFPVIDDNNMLMGVVNLDDIREIMFNREMYETTFVWNLMTLPPAFVSTSDHMDKVMKKFNDSNAWNLPVVTKGKYIGFVSKSKIFSVYRELLVDLSAD